ncbi:MULTISPECIES: phage tail protein [Methylobacterium]|uniref:phage tail protein n=1 Tax=Methylobacterium TaxID=407 RepID=UPI0013EA4C8B|nr:phage tail protein [Methylobacterium sp. DB0501]NGM34422.1 tail fiber protein [Methylobacterium sp. DB0501]
MADTGIIFAWGGSVSTIPAGYLLCDGTLVSQSQYPSLFNAIGFNFGANPPQGQFYLPDLRGRFVRGADDGAQRDPDVGSRTDMQNSAIKSPSVGSVQSHAFQNHNHAYTIFPNSSGDIASGDYWQAGPAVTALADPAQFQVSTETRPVNASVHFIIAC